MGTLRFAQSTLACAFGASPATLCGCPDQRASMARMMLNNGSSDQKPSSARDSELIHKFFEQVRIFIYYPHSVLTFLVLVLFIPILARIYDFFDFGVMKLF